MSYKYGLNGYDLNWDALYYTGLSEFCVDCARWELDEGRERTEEEIEYCSNHTIAFIPVSWDWKEFKEFLESGKHILDVTDWAIVIDTNSNFVDAIGDVPEKYFTEEYLQEKREAEEEE